ncbi:Uma2 family endonuclease [Nocardia sp. ET3-3]|uniref:Uma2 family endonuclease n=1 Tax=Nocardia terrae TaxID=2675851 RepID=A0A7K1V6C8_9NOCA|nr:Uma2 family endonuclease [Nocardia terrae]MVU82029.1 Uma2 family endonuclease [Nocardia terrae]
MTADPMPRGDRPVPDWPVPPPGGYFAEDLDHMRDLPRHTELIDGSLVFVSPQAMFHMWVIGFLDRELTAQAPDHLLVCREMSVTLSPRQRPEPDILIVTADSVNGPQQTSFLPVDVLLAVEVVSPDSIERDRKRKPLLYAEAEIPHFWRIENCDGRAVVYVYELDPATKVYEPAGIFHDRLQVSVPFPITLDLTEAARPKGGRDK